jgi:hypothetical protein
MYCNQPTINQRARHVLLSQNQMVMLFTKQLHANTQSEKLLALDGLCWLLPRLHRRLEQQQEIWNVLVQSFEFQLEDRAVLYDCLQSLVLADVVQLGTMSDDCSASMLVSMIDDHIDETTMLHIETEWRLHDQLCAQLSSILDSQCIALQLESSFPIAVEQCFTEMPRAIDATRDRDQATTSDQDEEATLLLCPDIGGLLSCSFGVWNRFVRMGI